MYIRMECGCCTAWYRKQGRYGFDFVTKKDYATNMTEAETVEVLRHRDFYLKMFGATKLIIES